MIFIFIFRIIDGLEEDIYGTMLIFMIRIIRGLI